MEELKPSIYQQAIYDFIKNEKGNLIVKADAGSGKTYTIKTALKYIPPTKSTIFVAFNKAIAVELQKEIPNHTKAMTLHSLGLKAIYSAFGKTKVDTKKLFKITVSLINENEKAYISLIMKMVDYLKNNLLEPTAKNIDNLAAHHSLELPINTKRYFQLVEKAYQKSIDKEDTIDFSDMICFPHIFNLKCKKYDFIFVDEANDLNAAQIDLVLRSIKPNGRIIAVGDENQCHPEDTIIQLTGNKIIPIKDIKIGMEVVSYFTGKSFFKGIRTKGRKVEEVSNRKYSGIIHNFSSGMKCTPNHRILVRWSKNTDNKHIVYLMRKGNSFRIGMANAIYKAKNGNRNAGLSMRCRHENAEEAWILSVHNSSNEAFVAEHVAHAKFGLAGTPFKPPSNSHDRLQKNSNEIYKLLGDSTDRAIKCLKYYNRDINYPLWNKVKVKNIGNSERTGLITRPHIIRACNFIPDFHEMKIFSGTTRGVWKKLSMFITYENTTVYSLKVQPTEGGKRLYVANNTVVHNSIYGFRDSNTESISKLTKILNATTLPLSISYRCPVSHIKLAQQLVSSIKAAPGAKEGKIINLLERDLYKYIRPGDLALCRNNAPLVKPCLSLLQRGIKATIKGRDIGKNLATLVKNFRARTIPELKQLIDKWKENEMERAAKKNQNPQLIEDKADCLYSFIANSGAKTPSQLIEYIKAIFSDEKAEIVFSSIHKAKGLESENVFFLQPNLIPSKYAEQEWEMTQEKNLYYVAITRAKENLYMVN